MSKWRVCFWSAVKYLSDGPNRQYDTRARPFAKPRNHGSLAGTHPPRGVLDALSGGTAVRLGILRELVARARARREHAFHGKERLLDFLFPGDQVPPQANKQPRRHTRLPDDLFPLIARFYWCGE